jgi:hypothetical protein
VKARELSLSGYLLRGCEIDVSAGRYGAPTVALDPARIVPVDHYGVSSNLESVYVTYVTFHSLECNLAKDAVNR